jgi:hypothetical protein
MRRLAVYGWSLSAGVVGFCFIALLGILLMELEQPVLTYAVTATTALFAVMSTAAITALAKKATPSAATTMGVLGVIALVLTQLLYWKFLLH